jgi:hypothetical protein
LGGSKLDHEVGTFRDNQGVLNLRESRLEKQTMLWAIRLGYF